MAEADVYNLTLFLDALATRLEKAMTENKPAVVKVPPGCEVVWQGDHLNVVTRDKKIEVRVEVPTNIVIKPRKVKGPSQIKIEPVESPPEEEEIVDMDMELWQKLEYIKSMVRAKMTGVEASKRETVSEIAIPPVLDTDAPTLIEMEYGMKRVSYIMGKSEFKRTLAALVLVKTSMISAARNLVDIDDFQNVAESTNTRTLVAPYLRTSKGVERINFPTDNMITLEDLPSYVSPLTKLGRHNWRYLPRVMGWGVDGVTAMKSWNKSDVVVAYTDASSSFYGLYLSMVLDLPLFDMSYTWFLKVRMKLPRRPIWEHKEEGRKYVVFWKHLEAFDNLGVKDVILLVSDKKCKGWVAETLQEEADVEVMEIYSGSSDEMADNVERIVAAYGEDINGREIMYLDEIPFIVHFRDIPSINVTLDNYKRVAKMAKERVIPVIK